LKLKIKGTEDPFEREVSVETEFSHVAPKVSVTLTAEEEVEDVKE